ncbi:uncharacterized protein BX664DRAFT_339632 [Halteromyces radiatus]|uniref:uncharacterized protein n=1 Tax=Halteromyces radiatus TaxID=101107 RepID=UPI002220A194|nr:uncharacterized protein BX664DRAFT_339632 [Halteromyces radiatus]KAI8083022.1 hypothetical protein BX664DRAFT_339632 [Halteromyces radiatus]
MKFSLQDSEQTELMQLIDKATDSSLTTENWTLFISICHKINQSPQAAKTTRKVIQKKILSMIPQTQLLTIALMKVITENCKSFDEQLGHETLIRSLRIIWNHPETYTKVRERIIECVYVWMIELGEYEPVHPIIQYCHEINQIRSIAPHKTEAWISTSPLPIQPQHHQQNRTVTPISFSNAATNRTSSLFRGWKLKRSNIKEKQQSSSHNEYQMISGCKQMSENNGEKVQECIEESKSTSGLLQQLLSNEQSRTNDPLLRELYQKCQDLQSNIMRYIETTTDPVYIGTLIDTNVLLSQVLETYKKNESSETLPKVVMMTEKALGKKPIRQNSDLRV